MSVNPTPHSVAASHRTGKNELQSIAHAAMLERGLLPDFSSAVIAETNQITQAATASGAAFRDLRGLLWASIDNDDSLDLDQLSVAEPLAGGVTIILVATADVDALVKKNRAKELIEDFMIATNGISAKYLEMKGLPSLRRVLRTPKRWDRIIDFAVVPHKS